MRGCTSCAATGMTRTELGGDARGEQARRNAVETKAPQAVVAESVPSWDASLGADYERELHMQRHMQRHSQQPAGSAPGCRPTRASVEVDRDGRIHGNAIARRRAVGRSRRRQSDSPIRAGARTKAVAPSPGRTLRIGRRDKPGCRVRRIRLDCRVMPQGCLRTTCAVQTRQRRRPLCPGAGAVVGCSPERECWATRPLSVRR